jgi:Ca-activated chloride channel homolog
VVSELESGRLDFQQRQRITQILEREGDMDQSEARQHVQRWEMMLSRGGQQGGQQRDQWGQQDPWGQQRQTQRDQWGQPRDPWGQDQQRDQWGQQGRQGQQSGRIFAIEDQRAEQRLQMISRQLERHEQQLKQSCEETKQLVQQAEQQQGEQKIDSLVQAMQNLVKEHEMLHTYLTELRSALTGEQGGSGQRQQPWGIQDPWGQDDADDDLDIDIDLDDDDRNDVPEKKEDGQYGEPRR